MSHSYSMSGRDRTGQTGGEPSPALSRADLAMLLTAERRLAAALARPAEVLRFFLAAVEETASLLRVDRALLCLIDPEDPRLLRVMAGVGALAEEEGEVLPVDGSFEGRVFSGLEPLRTSDLAAEPGLYRPRGIEGRIGPALGVPLRLRGRSVGVLLAAREPGGVPFLERDAEILREIAIPISAAIEAMRQFDVARRSREVVDAWNREQELRRWLARYETLAAARVELVFRLLPTGQVQWGGSTEPLLGIPAGGFPQNVEDFLAQVSPADVDGVRSAIERISSPTGPASVTATCGLIINGTIHPRQLRAWRIRGEPEIVGIICPPTAEAWKEPAEAADVEKAAESIVRTLRHQINNPLAAVIGRAQLLIREDRVQREHGLRQAVETILFESERINRFVQQLQSPEAIRRLAERLPGDD